MRGVAQPDGRPLGGSELRSYFSPCMDQSTPNQVCLCGSVCSLQRRFLINDFLLHSGAIRNQDAKVVRNRAKILLFFGSTNFGRKGPP